jgi:predicted O-methyltransferase YrrM
MATLLSARATWKLVRSGDLRARVRATRDGQAGIRLHLVAAALKLGVLDALAHEATTTGELVRRLGISNDEVFEPFLRTVAAAGLIAGGEDAPWRLTQRGRAVIEDDLVRASYEVFAGFHTGLYREMPQLLAGGPARRDVAEQGALIARISAAFEPFVLDVLTRTVTEHRPRRVLDIGCGAGLQLAAMLDAAPEAEGTGIDSDPGAAEIAQRTMVDRGLADRGHVLRAELRELLTEGATGPLAGPFDLILLANVIYYVPIGERVQCFRDIAEILSPRGTVLVISTAATPHLVSRHFDLLLRAQEGEMELPDVDTLVTQLSAAGLIPGPPRTIAPGNPLVAVAADRPGG